MAEKTLLTVADRLELDRLAQRIRLARGHGGIFLIEVPDERVRQAVQEGLQQQLRPVEWRSLDVSRADILLELAHVIQTRAVNPEQTILTCNLLGLEPELFRRLLVAINLRREYVPDNRALLMVFHTREQVTEIVTLARDFWSFHTATVHIRPPAEYVPPDRTGQEALARQIQEAEQAVARAASHKGGLSGQAWLHGNLAELLDRAGRSDAALEHWQSAAGIYRRLRDRRNLGAALSNIGNIYHARGDLDAALKYFQEALKIAQKIGARRLVAAVERSIEETRTARADRESARKCRQQA